MTSTATLELVVKLQDDASKKLAAIADQVKALGERAKQAEQQTGGFAAQLKAVAAGTLVADGLKALTGAVTGVGRAMVGGNAEMERYSVQFNTLLGTVEQTQERLAEVTEMAVDTPFQLPDVVTGDKIIEGFGLHSLEAAQRFKFSGDQIRTISADVAAYAGTSFTEMSKYLGQFSAGSTGMALERFEELGIVTRTQLAQMGVEFSKSNELISPLPKAMTILLTHMQQRYGGLAAAQSQTFEGMQSNLQDWISDMAREFGKPVFDALKKELGNLLEYVNRPETKEALTKLAADFGDFVKTAVPLLVQGAKDIASNLGTLFTILKTTAEIVSTIFIPAISGATAALIVYSVVALTKAIPSTSALMTLIFQTIPAFAGQAAAAAATLGPFAAIALAVGGMAYAWQSYSAKQQAALDQLLQSREWWTQSQGALEAYNASSGKVKAATQEEANALRVLTEAQKADLDSLARRKELGVISEAQFQKELAAINERIPAIRMATDALTKHRLELENASKWSNDGLIGLENMTGGMSAMGSQAALTSEQVKELAEKLAKISQEGAAALQSLIPATANFLSGLSSAASAHTAKLNQIVADSRDTFAKLYAARAKIAVDAGKQFAKIEADLGKKLGDIAEQTGEKIADINKQANDKLAQIDQKAIDERKEAYKALQEAISTSMADLVADQEANDLDLAGATDERLAELRRREAAEGASRQRLAAAGIEAQQRAAKGEAVIAGQIFKIRQEGIGKRVALDEAFAKRQAELAGNPAALAELQRQYNEAVAAEQAAEQQRIAIAEAEQQEKERAREEEKQAVRQAQAAQIAATQAAAAEQIKAAKAAAGEQKKATAEQLAEQKKANAIQLSEARQARAEKLAAEEQAYEQERLRAAEAYAEQAAQQRAHLGEMLIDRVTVLQQAGLVTKEQAAVMTNALKVEYGVAETSASLTFGRMSAVIDQWSKDSTGNTNAYIGTLHTLQTDAVGTQQKLDAMAKTYRIQIDEDFKNKKISAEQYADAIAKIPSKVRTELELLTKFPNFAPGPRRVGGAVDDDQVLPGIPRRARGGPVWAGQPYIVGEKRPELFVPDQNGTILPRLPQTAAPWIERPQLPQTATRPGGGVGGGNTISITTPITVNMPARASASVPDMQAFRQEIQQIADEVVVVAIERVIARDL